MITSCLAVGLAAAAAAAPAPDFTRLDPRLLNAALAAPDDTVAVWVRFADKGEQGPADLAARLAAAAAALDPHARARRERAHVWPLVDALDLPVHAPYLAALRARGFAPYGVSRWFNQAALHVPGARLAELTRLPFVRLVAPVTLGRVRGAPGVPAPIAAAAPAGAAQPAGAARVAIAYGRTFGALQQLNLPAVHDSGYIGTGVRLCMLDDGFNWYRTHEALAGIDVPPGWTRDFVDGDGDPTDTTSQTMYHGSATLACVGGNAPGVYVGSGYGASFMLARTEKHGSEHWAEMVNWDMGAEWADSLGADIISSSLGYTTFDLPDSSYHYSDMDGHTTIVSRAAEIAASKGMLVVNAAGNAGSSAWHFVEAPADVNGDSLIAAAAVDTFGVVAATSSRGPTFDGRLKPDLAARGVSVPIVYVNVDHVAGYGFLSGTSFSAPFIAGACACLMQARPAWTPTHLIAALKATASRAANPDTLIGWGIPDVLAALATDTLVAPPPPPPPPPAPVTLLGPNPLHLGGPGTELRLGALAGPVRVRVLDAAGRLVRRLEALGDRVHWDGRGERGGDVRPGPYVIVVEAGGKRYPVKVVLLP